MSQITNFGTGGNPPGTLTLNYTYVDVPSYTVVSTDEFLGVDTTSEDTSILLPDAPVMGRVYIVKDIIGNAVAHNITVTTVSGATDIDGATTYIMNAAYSGVNLLFNGSAYLIF
jgi:hypothetical protein